MYKFYLSVKNKFKNTHTKKKPCKTTEKEVGVSGDGEKNKLILKSGDS
jgi:hypothetical protein